MRKRQTAAIAELERLELKDAEALCGADGEARVALVQADAEDPLGAGFGGHLGVGEDVVQQEEEKEEKKKNQQISLFVCARWKKWKKKEKKGDTHLSINLFIFLFPLLHPSQTKKRLGTEHITKRAVQQRGTQGPTRWARSRRCRQGQT